MKLRNSGLVFAVAFVTTLLVGGAVAPAPARADVSIQSIQLLSYPEGTVVQCDSVVVTGAGFYGYFVEEPIPHPTWGRQYSGIWVFTGPGHTMHKGDLVSVRGTYAEYFGSSELDVGTTGHQIYMGHVAVPPPVPVAISEVNDTGALSEAYECVFVKVDRLDPTLWSYQEYDGASNKKYWTLRTNSDGSGDSLSIYHENSLAGGDFAYGAPDPGSPFTHLQGILQYTRDRYRLAPRSCEEDFGAPCKPRLAGAFSTGTTGVDAEFDVNVEQASANNPGNYELLSGQLVLTAQRDPVRLNTVHLVTQPLVNGAAEQLIVSNVKSSGGLTMDPNQTADFLSGITPIYDIQFVANPAVHDSSSKVGAVVTIEGRVTGVEGNYYYLQEGTGGPWRGIYCRVAKTGILRVGDRVQASGEVSEYFGMTEVIYKPGIDNYKYFGHDPTAPVVNILSTADLHYRDTARSAERWESGLVKLLNATFRDSIPGTAGPYYKEWLLKQGAASDTAMVDLDGMTVAGGSYDPCPNNRADITGVLHFAFDKYRIYPRSGRGNDIHELFAAPGCPTTGVDPVNPVSYLDLRQNWPNPFGVETRIGFSLAQASQVRLEVVDVSGRLVKVLAAAPLAAGDHLYEWDGSTGSGHRAAAGTYFYRLRCDGQETSRRMVMLK